MAGLTFLVGGRAIHEFAKADRMLAEMEGLGLAAVLAGLGAGAKTIANEIPEESEDNAT
jgi:hypothetical protein